MAKSTLVINGKVMNINTNNPKVADLCTALVKALIERQYPIGMVLDHKNGEEYILARILQWNGTHRAYLINQDTGIARNSDRVVTVQDAKGGGEFGRGYVTVLPARKDCFFDPDADDGSFLPND